MFMYMAPVIWGRPMPSPISKMTFLGLARSTEGLSEDAAWRVPVQEAIKSRPDRIRVVENRLPDGHEFLAWKGFDSALKFKRK